MTLIFAILCKTHYKYMQLTDKVALITGAGSGIAKATAILFAQEPSKSFRPGRTLVQPRVHATKVRVLGHEHKAGISAGDSRPHIWRYKVIVDAALTEFLDKMKVPADGDAK